MKYEAMLNIESINNVYNGIMERIVVVHYDKMINCTQEILADKENSIYWKTGPMTMTLAIIYKQNMNNARFTI